MLLGIQDLDQTDIGSRRLNMQCCHPNFDPLALAYEEFEYGGQASYLDHKNEKQVKRASCGPVSASGVFPDGGQASVPMAKA